MSGNSRSSKGGMNALVAMIDPNLATASTSFGSAGADQPNAPATKNQCECVQLPDPADASHQSSRTYLVTAEKAICELQAFAPASSSDYGSFFVNGAYVVGNGNLHTVSPVDPLFWFLGVHNHTVVATTTEGEKGQQQQQWQPLEQILADQALDRRIVEAVTDRNQLGHIFETMQLPGAADEDEEKYYKFSVAKTLEWLTNKQQRVETVLWQQESHLLGREEQQQQDTSMESENVGSGGGAFSSSFNVAADLQPETAQSQSNAESTKEQREKELHQRCREESVQVVCTYLNSVWRERFLLHLKLNETVLMSPKKRRQLQLKEQQQQQASAGSQNNHGEQAAPSFMPAVTAAVDWNDVNTTETKKLKVEAPSITYGAKKLAKVNTKGMKSMSSFFGAKPASKKETKKIIK
jgi:hypothetical protein